MYGTAIPFLQRSRHPSSRSVGTSTSARSIWLATAASPMLLLHPKTSICSSAPRADSSSPRRPYCHFALRHGRARHTARSFFSRRQIAAGRDGRYLRPIASIGQQLAPAVRVGANSYSLGYSAKLTPRYWRTRSRAGKSPLGARSNRRHERWAGAAATKLRLCERYTIRQPSTTNTSVIA